MAARIEGMPRLRSVVENRGTRRPRWRVQASLDLNHHVQALAFPPDGQYAALRALVSDLMAERLEQDRPLWRVWLVTQAPDGQWALVVKAHHALVDGESGADLLGCLLDRTAPATPPPHAAPPGQAMAQRTGVSALRDLQRGLRTLVRPDLPPSVLNGPFGGTRQWDWLTVDRAEVEEAAQRRGCTVNDVFLAVLSGALRQVLLASGQTIGPVVVRAIVPVSQRTTGERVQPGTVASAMFVELPVHEPDVIRRLSLITSRTAEQKDSAVASGTRAVVRAADAIPAPLLARAAAAYVRRGQRRVNAAATNVRGMEGEFTLMGRPLREAVPWIPIALDVRVTAALLSFGSSSSISVTADGGTVSDVGALIDVIKADLGTLMTT